MMKATRDELDGILGLICDEICRWPYMIDDQEEMTDRCGACPVTQKLEALVGRLDGKAAKG